MKYSPESIIDTKIIICLKNKQKRDFLMKLEVLMSHVYITCISDTYHLVLK